MLPLWVWLPHLTDKANNLLSEQWEILNIIQDDPASPDVEGLWEMITDGERALNNLRAENRIWK